MYRHGDDAHTQVGAPEVNAQRALRLQDVVDVLGHAVLTHRRETEGLLDRYRQIDGLQELQDPWHGIPISVDLGAAGGQTE